MRIKVVLSVLITMMLMFSLVAVYVNNIPGPNRETLTVGPVPNIATTDDTSGPVSEEKTITNSESYSSGAEDQGTQEDDGCGTPPEDECGSCDPCDPCNPCDPCDPCDPCNPCDPCDPCDECGCTYTIGYWKNHAGIGHGNQADLVTPLIASAGGVIWLGDKDGTKSVEVSTAAEAKNILNRQDSSSNGINRLYAQLLAAKLNILNGASDKAVDDTIAAAEAFLAEHGSVDWDGLSIEEQQNVNEWKDVLDNYNNGLIGPGHCD
jgi:hypothetical protein